MPPRLVHSGFDEWDETGISRLPNKAEIAGMLFTRFLSKAVPIAFLLVVATAVAIAVPAYSVAGSDAYRAAREFVATNPRIVRQFGPVSGSETVPTIYSVERDRAQFTFNVFGEGGTTGVATLSLERDGVWRVTSGAFTERLEAIGLAPVLKFSPADLAPIHSR